MANIEQNALTALKASFNTLMPTSLDPQIMPLVVITPLNIRPAGIGGFIGVQPDPAGEIQGRRIEASVQISLKANDEETLADLTSAVTSAVMGASRTELVQKGFFKITPHPLASAYDAGGPHTGRNITFTILFEYLQAPEAGEDIISTIPLNVITDGEI